MGFKNATKLLLFNDSNVNTKQTGASLIFINPASSTLNFPYRVRVYGANLNGVISHPTFSIGTNSTAYNNILSATVISGLLDNTYIDYPLVYPISTVNFTNGVYVNITNAASATNYGCRFAVYLDYF